MRADSPSFAGAHPVLISAAPSLRDPGTRGRTRLDSGTCRKRAAWKSKEYGALKARLEWEGGRAFKAPAPLSALACRLRRSAAASAFVRRENRGRAERGRKTDAGTVPRSPVAMTRSLMPPKPGRWVGAHQRRATWCFRENSSACDGASWHTRQTRMSFEETEVQLPRLPPSRGSRRRLGAGLGGCSVADPLASP